MRAPDSRLIFCTLLATLTLAGCGRKQAAAPEANMSAADASAAMLDNGTISDITATDATIGSTGGVAPSNSTESPTEPDSANGNAAAAGAPLGNSE